MKGIQFKINSKNSITVTYEKNSLILEKLLIILLKII